MEKKRFKQHAKILTDSLFDNKLFKEEITRDDMNAIEEYIVFCLESNFNSYVKIKIITDKINK